MVEVNLLTGKSLNKQNEDNEDNEDYETSMSNFVIDHLILDEAASTHKLDLLGATMCGAKTLLLVGDHHQLGPVVSGKLYQLGYSFEYYKTSTMEDLVKSFEYHMLTTQYRMPRDLADIVSKIFYNNKIITGNHVYKPASSSVQLVRVKGKEKKLLAFFFPLSFSFPFLSF